MAKKTYTALDSIRFDGEDYAEGAPIEMEEKQAKPLVEAGVLEAAAETKAKK